MRGINFKAIILSVLIATILSFFIDLIINGLSSILFGGSLFLFPIDFTTSFIGLVFGSVLICGLVLVFMVLYPSIAALLYYRFNNFSISVSEGVIVGVTFWFSRFIIYILIFFLFGNIFSSKEILAPRSLIFVICQAIQLFIYTVVGAAVGSFFERKQKSQNFQDNLHSEKETISRTKWEEW